MQFLLGLNESPRTLEYEHTVRGNMRFYKISCSYRKPPLQPKAVLSRADGNVQINTNRLTIKHILYVCVHEETLEEAVRLTQFISSTPFISR